MEVADAAVLPGAAEYLWRAIAGSGGMWHAGRSMAVTRTKMGILLLGFAALLVAPFIENPHGNPAEAIAWLIDLPGWVIADRADQLGDWDWCWLQGLFNIAFYGLVIGICYLFKRLFIPRTKPN